MEVVIDSLTLTVSGQNNSHLMFVVFAKLIFSFLGSVSIYWALTPFTLFQALLWALRIHRGRHFAIPQSLRTARTMRLKREADIYFVVWGGPEDDMLTVFSYARNIICSVWLRRKARLSGWESGDPFLFNQRKSYLQLITTYLWSLRWLQKLGATRKKRGTRN